MVRKSLAKKNWMFTSFSNVDEWDTPEIMPKAFGIQLKYGIFQIEKCPNTDKLHIQGYLEFKNAMRLSTLRNALPGAHYEARLGSRQQAVEYCGKEDTKIRGPYIFGTTLSVQQGRRTDWEPLKSAIREGRPEVYIFENFFAHYLRYNKAISRAMKLFPKRRTTMTTFSVIMGPPGTGKTRMVQLLYPNAYWKNHTKWWDGYIGQGVIVLDEFNGFLSPTLMNMLAGVSTPLAVEVKGGVVDFVGTKIVLISNVGLCSWWNWNNIRTPIRSVLRRIGELIIMRETGTEFYYDEQIETHINDY